MTDIAIRYAPQTLIRTATTWGTWAVLVGWQAAQASEGAGQICGDAILVREVGRVIPPKGDTAITRTADYILGQYVQILLADAGGDVSTSYTDENGASVSFQGFAIWHGTAVSSQLEDEGPLAGRLTVQAVGLAVVLEQLKVTNGWEQREGAAGVGPSNVVNLHHLPPFNRRGGMDRSASMVVVDGIGTTSYVHRRGNPSNAWTAAQILDYVLKLAARGEYYNAFTKRGPVWTVSDPQGCLTYWPINLDLNGKSVLEVVNTIVNARRGLTWRLVMTAGQPVITVSSAVYSAITVGSYTLPAAPTPATPDLTGIAPEDVRVAVDTSAQYDVIELIGDRPWVGMTFRCTPATAPASSALIPRTWTLSSAVEGELNYRALKLNQAWTGTQDASTTVGLRQKLAMAVDGSMDGTRSYDTAEGSWQPEALTLTGELPIFLGWSTTSTEQRQPGVAVMVGSGVAVDLTLAPLNQSSQPQLAMIVEDQPPGVLLGAALDDAMYLKTWYDASAYLLVSVGVREAAPLKVRWVRDSAEWPRDLPRVLSVVNPAYQQELVLAGTVTGVNSDGVTVMRTGSTQTLRDDVPAMRQALALLRAYYAEPAVALSWTDRGAIDHAATLVPGRMLGDVTLGAGVTMIGAVIARRSWQFEPLGQVGTTYTTERVVPDLEALR